MNKGELAYIMYDAGVISFDDYMGVDSGGSNVLVDAMYVQVVAIQAEAGRAGYIQALKDFSPVIEDFSERDFKAADIYAERVKRGEV